jgi:DMSO reductase anchor subunit
MHPALSATIATTAGGLASGLLVLLGLIAPGTELPKTVGFGAIAFALAIGGIAAALIYSAGRQGTLPGAPVEHLHWMARTRLMLALNLVAASLFGFGWTVLGSVDGLWRGAGLVAATLGLVSLFAHARVYVAVASVAAWHNRWIVLNFFAMGFLAGALWLNALVHIFADGNPQIALLGVISLFFVFYVKRAHWRDIDRGRAKRRLIATGPGEDHGNARPAFYIPPDRTRRLRRQAFIFMLAIPLGLELLAMGKPGTLASLMMITAALSGTAGIVIERWLFFTDASNTDDDENSVDILA